MFGLPQSAAELEEDMIQVTPHAKKLEDARLAFNQVLTDQRTYKSNLKQHRQALDIISDRISREKETAINKADKDFEESQAKAKKDHAAHKAVLEKGFEIQHRMERIRDENMIRRLRFDNRDAPEKAGLARDAYHKADLEFMDEMVKRRTQLEVKGELKRKRGVSPEGALSQDCEDSPVIDPDAAVSDDVIDQLECIDRSPPKKSRRGKLLPQISDPSWEMIGYRHE